MVQSSPCGPEMRCMYLRATDVSHLSGMMAAALRVRPSRCSPNSSLATRKKIFQRCDPSLAMTATLSLLMVVSSRTGGTDALACCSRCGSMSTMGTYASRSTHRTGMQSSAFTSRSHWHISVPSRLRTQSCAILTVPGIITLSRISAGGQSRRIRRTWWCMVVQEEHAESVTGQPNSLKMVCALSVRWRLMV